MIRCANHKTNRGRAWKYPTSCSRLLNPSSTLHSTLPPLLLVPLTPPSCGHYFHWQHQDIIYDFWAQIEGSGSRSDWGFESKFSLTYKLMSISSYLRSWQRGAQPAAVHPLRLINFKNIFNFNKLAVNKI